MNARIVIVDDHEIVREGIRTLLAKTRPEWIISGEAADGITAVQMIRDLSPDIVVLDLTMPGISGFETAARIRKLGLRSRILVFTTHEFERLDNEVRQVGADGYVLKTQAARNLVAAIDALLAGGTFFGAPTQPQSEPNEGPNSGIIFRRRLKIAPA
jgi:DNA-binding NarL/FixJ family response regulator